MDKCDEKSKAIVLRIEEEINAAQLTDRLAQGVWNEWSEVGGAAAELFCSVCFSRQRALPLAFLHSAGSAFAGLLAAYDLRW